MHSRFSVRILWFAFLVLLAAGVAAVPFRLAAQEAASPAQSQPSAQVPASQAQAQGEANPESAQTEESESNKFRHTALIKSVAKALHLSVEATARSFEIINFAIVVLALGIPLVRFLPKVFRKRAQTVLHNIETARKVTEDANSRLSAIEAKLSGLDEEIAQIRAQVEEESRQDEARIKAAFEEESARIVAAAEQEIGVAAAQAKRGLRHFAADLAIEQAAKQLVLTPETDQALIAEFLCDVAANGANKGGQN